MSTRRKYTAEFKREAVKLSEGCAGSVADVARELEKCFPTDRVYIVTLQIG